MHRNLNFSYKTFVCRRDLKTSKILGVRDVDQFFTLKVNMSNNGWHSSDVSLLDKASKLNDQGARYTALLQHIKVLMAENHEGDNRSFREIFDSLKPAYLQSPTEVIGWLEWLSANYGENVTQTNNDLENHEEITKETTTDSASSDAS